MKKGITKEIITILISVAVITLLFFVRYGIPLLGLPDVENIVRVEIVNARAESETAVVTEPDRIELARKAAGYLNYIPGKAEGGENLLTVRYEDKNGDIAELSINETTVWWKGKAYKLREPKVFVNIVEGLFLSGKAESEAADSGAAETEEETEEEPFVPSKEDVYAMREKALEGMSEEETARLTENIKVANLQMEREYMYNDLFGKLADPDDLYWNYVDQKGEIQIGWAFEEGMEYDSSLGMTFEEYAEQYGTAVTAYNRFDADNFIALMQEMKNSLKNDLLKEDLDRLIDNTKLAKESHDAAYIVEVYHILHDMDYFLLRYGLEDVGKYVKDRSMLATYYDSLEIYRGEE